MIMCSLVRPELGDSPRWNELSLDTVLAYCPTRYSTSCAMLVIITIIITLIVPVLAIKATDILNIFITITSLLWRAATKMCAKM